MSDERDNAIVVLPGEQEIQGVAPASMEDIKAIVEKARFMGEQLDRLRAIAVKATLPSDWVKFGDSVYLEGDGGIRLAPIIGLRMINPKPPVFEALDNGVVRVSQTATFESALFGTRFEGLSNSRQTDDGFLSRGGGKADLQDCISAVYKGLIAKGAAMCAGLTGLTAEELKDRYGVGVKSEVKFQTGASQAKSEDKAKAAGGVLEIHRILRKLSGGDEELAADILQELTKNPEKGWSGKRKPENLTENGVNFVLRELRARETQFDASPRQPDLNLGEKK